MHLRAAVSPWCVARSRYVSPGSSDMGGPLTSTGQLLVPDTAQRRVVVFAACRGGLQTNSHA